MKLSNFSVVIRFLFLVTSMNCNAAKLTDLISLEGESESYSDSETKTTTSGHVFTRDFSNPKLGEAWRDPSGMVWGDMLQAPDGTPVGFSPFQGMNYCKSINAKSPTKEDYIRLREYMGAKSGTYVGFQPQILPNMNYQYKGYTFYRSFWSSTVHPDKPKLYYVFEAGNGRIDTVPHSSGGPQFRCVADSLER